MMNRRQYLKSCILFGASYTLGVKGVFANSEKPSSVKRKQLRLNITLRNDAGTNLEKPFLWMAAPANVSSQQLRNIEASASFDLESDILGQNILIFEFQNIGPYATKLVNVIADVEWTDVRNHSMLEPNMWLKNERLIESDNQQIKALANQVKRQNDAQTSFAIYNWVRDSLRYAGYIPDNLGALYALKNLRGDCTEYACLAVALARANEIPARMVGGYFINKERTVKARDYHHWAEVYFDGQWHLLDAQKGNWQRSQFDYITYNYYQTSYPTKIGLSKRYKTSAKLNVVY